MLLLDAPLIAGLLPTAVSAGGAVAALYLLVRRGRRWWLRDVPVALAVGAGVALLCAVAVAVLRPFPDPLPPRVLVWIGVPVAAAALARAGRDRRRALVAVALLAVVATSAVKVNAFYGYRPSLAAALDLPAADQVDLSAVPLDEPLVGAPDGVALDTRWRPPPDMPDTGRIARVDIPGTASGFAARPGWVYLPPAYLGSTRARLPVLVLVPGQPGGPQDWLLAGRLAEVADRFAAAHDGLAPVVVVPDVTGSDLGDTMCLDSRLGRAETYLAVDVPAWVAGHLQVDPVRRAIGGFSFGGTCAVQLAVRRPDVYPTFLDVSGQAEPTLGDRASTVAQAFDGDEDAFRRVAPLDELASGSRPAGAGVFAVGRDDPDYRPQAEQVAAAAAAAGMAVSLDELPGGHSWSTAAEALARALPWIGARGGLFDPSTPPPSTPSP